MFHVELRQFPHTAWRFNLSEQEVRAILLPWTREQVVDMGERKWSPHKATLTVLEGPKLELQQLSMGRGWRTAERDGVDVTARILDELAVTVPAPGPGDGRVETAPSASASSPSAISQLEALLGAQAPVLLEAWRAAAAASEGLSPSETLAIAEDALARRKRA